MDEKTIQPELWFMEKKIAGLQLFAPACMRSIQLAKFAKCRTMTPYQIHILEALGFEFRLINKGEKAGVSADE